MGLPPIADSDDPLWGHDAALALYICYELHYSSFAGVDERWEWEPSLLAARAAMEAAFERRLVDEVGVAIAGPGEVADELVALANGRPGAPSLAAHVEEQGTLDQLQELAIHRSAYQLKEADPHTWAIPRLRGRAKAALVEIQAGEYGHGVADRMHATLFATTLRGLGLDDRCGAYLDRLPGTTLATVNLMSLFGLHRRWRGALVGHLAHFEMCSVVPMARYARALRRLGIAEDGIEFYDDHVEVDLHHEVVALRDLAGGLVAAEPGLASDVVFGARALQRLEAAFADHVLRRWRDGQSSLLPRS